MSFYEDPSNRPKNAFASPNNKNATSQTHRDRGIKILFLGEVEVAFQEWEGLGQSTDIKVLKAVDPQLS